MTAEDLFHGRVVLVVEVGDTEAGAASPASEVNESAQWVVARDKTHSFKMSLQSGFLQNSRIRYS